jgi:hypothetical protein
MTDLHVGDSVRILGFDGILRDKIYTIVTLRDLAEDADTDPRVARITQHGWDKGATVAIPTARLRKAEQ